MKKLKRFIQNIIKYLYWKLKCNQIDGYAFQLLLYVMPSKMTKKKCSLLLGKIEDATNEAIKNHGYHLPPEPLKFNLKPIGFREFPGKDITILNNLEK